VNPTRLRIVAVAAVLFMAVLSAAQAQPRHGAGRGAGAGAGAVAGSGPAWARLGYGAGYQARQQLRARQGGDDAGQAGTTPPTGRCAASAGARHEPASGLARQVDPSAERPTERIAERAGGSVEAAAGDNCGVSKP
jgi:hypothetical protein